MQILWRQMGRHSLSSDSVIKIAASSSGTAESCSSDLRDAIERLASLLAAARVQLLLLYGESPAPQTSQTHSNEVDFTLTSL